MRPGEHDPTMPIFVLLLCTILAVALVVGALGLAAASLFGGLVLALLVEREL
jgi:hypothetical protein